MSFLPLIYFCCRPLRSCLVVFTITLKVTFKCASTVIASNEHLSLPLHFVMGGYSYFLTFALSLIFFLFLSFFLLLSLRRCEGAKMAAAFRAKIIKKLTKHVTRHVSKDNFSAVQKPIRFKLKPDKTYSQKSEKRSQVEARKNLQLISQLELH